MKSFMAYWHPKISWVSRLAVKTASRRITHPFFPEHIGYDKSRLKPTFCC